MDWTPEPQRSLARSLAGVAEGPQARQLSNCGSWVGSVVRIPASEIENRVARAVEPAPEKAPEREARSAKAKTEEPAAAKPAEGSFHPRVEPEPKERPLLAEEHGHDEGRVPRAITAVPVTRSVSHRAAFSGVGDGWRLPSSSARRYPAIST
jgi:hypothetical protein